MLPPWGTGLAAGPLRRLGLRIPPEMLNQLRYGRGLDNRKLKAAGYRSRYTTREAVIRPSPSTCGCARSSRGAREPYRYEREVEEFLRWSPSVRAPWRPDAGKPGRAATRQGETHGYDELEPREIVALLPSLAPEDLEALRTPRGDGGAPQRGARGDRTAAGRAIQ